MRRPQWVSTARHTADGWQLFGRGQDQGTFDAVVIAHNGALHRGSAHLLCLTVTAAEQPCSAAMPFLPGTLIRACAPRLPAAGKCANRLSAPMGTPDVHAQLKRLRLSANWVLMAAFASPVPVPGGLEGAFIEGCDTLSWAGNNSAKLGLPAGPQCWTLVSTQAFGKANKVPQVRCGWGGAGCHGNGCYVHAHHMHRAAAISAACLACLQESVPPEVAERVTRDMLAAFERSLGLPRGALPPVVFTQTQVGREGKEQMSRAGMTLAEACVPTSAFRTPQAPPLNQCAAATPRHVSPTTFLLQLWGAALPLNSPRVPCIWDPVGRAGVCG